MTLNDFHSVLFAVRVHDHLWLAVSSPGNGYRTLFLVVKSDGA